MLLPSVTVTRSDSGSPVSVSIRTFSAHCGSGLALQMSVQSRLNALADNLRLSGHNARCDVTVDTERAIAEVNCADAADRAVPWVYLQGLLVAGTVAADSPTRQCFRLAEQQLSTGPCPSAPEPIIPATRRTSALSPDR